MSYTPQLTTTVDLYNVVQRSINIVGIEKTIINVTNGLKKENMAEYPCFLTVITEVGKTLDITTKEILYGTGRRNERHYAIGFCAYYLRYIYKCKMEIVTILLEKDESVCYKYSRMIQKLKPQHSADLRYIRFKEALDIVLKPVDTVLKP